MKRFLQFIAIFILLFIVIPISNAKIKRLNTAEFKKILTSNNKKKIVLFWASYCPFCKRKIKELFLNKDRLIKKNATVILISIDISEKAAINAYKKLNVTFPLYLASKELIDEYNIRLVPITAIFDEKGDMHDISPGYKSLSEIFEMLN